MADKPSVTAEPQMLSPVGVQFSVETAVATERLDTTGALQLLPLLKEVHSMEAMVPTVAEPETTLNLKATAS
jgi:hypothetical protein